MQTPVHLPRNGGCEHRSRPGWNVVEAMARRQHRDRDRNSPPASSFSMSTAEAGGQVWRHCKRSTARFRSRSRSRPARDATFTSGVTALRWETLPAVWRRVSISGATGVMWSAPGASMHWGTSVASSRDGRWGKLRWRPPLMEGWLSFLQQAKSCRDVLQSLSGRMINDLAG